MREQIRVQVVNKQTSAQSIEWLVHTTRVNIELFKEVSEWIHAKP